MKAAIVIALAFSFFLETIAARDEITLPEHERQAINALVGNVFAIGMPDTRGGKYYVGPARVTQRFDPDTASPVLPMEYCSIQSTVPDTKEMDYTFTVPGPHFKLSDGRWLLGLQYLIRLNAEVQISTQKMQGRELKRALQRATKEYSFEPSGDFDEWFLDLSAKNLDEIKTGVTGGVPLWRYFQLSRNDTTIGMLCLLRAGVDEAEVLAYTIADTRCRDFWRMNYWSGTEGPFDPTGSYSDIEKLEEIWHRQHASYPVETPSVAFRRDLHRYFFYLLRQPEHTYSLDTMAALAHATLDPGDPQHLKKRIDALVEGKRIAKVPPHDANLETKLMAWDASERTMKITNTPDGANPGLTTVFVAPSPAYVPKREDLPSLFALLNDERPTRWIDYQGVRTLGENAMRAIAQILEENPLKLADRDTLESWTPERRRDVNQALLKWWETNQGTYVTPSP